MANPQHVEWLLEGVESWNKRFLEGNFTPDFEGANIYWEFREVGKLDHDGMIPLAGVIFGDPYSPLTYGNVPHSFYDEFVEPVKETSAYQNWIRSVSRMQFSTETPSDGDFGYKRANLNGANLNMANLAGANLNSVDLAGAKLAYANLARTDLEYTDLSNANLCGSRIVSASLDGTNLTGAYLHSACLTDSVLRSATLDGADFRSASLVGANFDDATVINTNFKGTDLKGASWARTELWKANIFTGQSAKQHPGF